MALLKFNLLPQEEKFYRMIEELVGYAHASARLLLDLVNSTDEKAIIHYGHDISNTKIAAKKVYETLTMEVCRTFITPFDREDIQAFAYNLYNIPKFIEKAQDRIITHKLRSHMNDFNRMAEIIVLEANAMTEVIRILNNGRKIKEMHEKVAMLHELEDKGDQLLGQLIADVFWNVSDTREVILRKDVYEMLEEVTDFYRDCANLALQIILKHS